LSESPCARTLELPQLLEYWLGELAPAEEEALEAHFFACRRCSGELEAFVALAGGIRSAFRDGALHAVVSPPFLRAMRDRGLQVREYPVSPGGSVQCTLGAGDDAVVGRLQAPLAGVRRLDLVNVVDGAPEIRLADIPFDPAAGEVIFCPAAAWLRSMPAHTDKVRLLAVEPAGEKTIGEYTFVHTGGAPHSAP
jgi:anti-sigma factor RsiW